MLRLFPLALAVAAATSLSACQFIRDDINKTLGRGEGPPSAAAATALTQAGVNPFLWRAALDTLAFAPIEQAEPGNRAIQTGWYAPQGNQNERMRVTAQILHTELRADGLRVLAQRQVNQNGQWVEAPVAAATVQRLEEIILTRARDLSRAARV
ncbi:MAG: DUF3576 domain-containing protein [Allosphingosinicella sp.]|uniref:DUF3576 domain-containing protein n=1 Tax=Allosphingosinicella sp. TaxID=2823234 RepID=UPI003935D4C7